MASSMWAQVARCSASRIAQAQAHAPLLRRSFITLTPRTPSRNVPHSCRADSSLATARDDAVKLAPAPTLTEPRVAETKMPVSVLADHIDKKLLKAIQDGPFHYTHLSAVQEKVLPLLPALAEPYDESTAASGRDLLVKAKTGTGKTMAFLVPAIEARLKLLQKHVDKVIRDSGIEPTPEVKLKARQAFARQNTGALIISPTRELATQIAVEARKLTSHFKEFEVRLFVGGESKGLQMREFTRGTHDIIVATPGRLRDVIDSHPLVQQSLAKTQLLILDEADTLLDMGFRDDIEYIKSFLPPTPQRQTFLFSATVSSGIQQIARSTLSKNHLFINCVSKDDSPVHAHVPQYHTVLPSASHQIPHILRLIAHDQLTNPGKSKIVLFFPTTKMTQLFTTILKELVGTLPATRRTSIYEIHSKKTMEQRTRASDRFRHDASGAAVLATSDVSARGVDYPNVTRVIQVGIPVTSEQYIHRVGRTGRAGKTNGRGDLVLLPWEMGFVTWQLTSVPIKPVTVKELAEQVTELAAKFDEDPQGFFGPGFNASPAEVVPSKNRKFQRGGEKPVAAVNHKMFKHPTTPVLEEIERSVIALQPSLDEGAINETFTSLLGFYVPRAGDMRTRKDVVVEGIKRWTVEAAGMAEAPHLSLGFLNRLGAGDVQAIVDRKRNKGGRSRDGDDYSYSSARKPSWTGRGSVKGRSTSRSYDSGYEGASGGGRGGGSASAYGGSSRSRDSGSSSYGSRDGGSSSSYGGREGGSSSYGSRDGGSSSYGSRDRGSYGDREGSSSSSSYGSRSGGSSYGSRDNASRPPSRDRW